MELISAADENISFITEHTRFVDVYQYMNTAIDILALEKILKA
jgi:hypothetical protein